MQTRMRRRTCRKTNYFGMRTGAVVFCCSQRSKIRNTHDTPESQKYISLFRIKNPHKSHNSFKDRSDTVRFCCSVGYLILAETIVRAEKKSQTRQNTTVNGKLCNVHRTVTRRFRCVNRRQLLTALHTKFYTK